MLPSTKIYKVDFKFLVENSLNRKLWGKKWVVFAYDKIAIDMELSSIDIINNKLRLLLSLRITGGKDYLGHDVPKAWVTLPLQESSQNYAALKRSFVAEMQDIIVMFEKSILKSYKGYKRALEYDNALAALAETRAKQVLDDNSIYLPDVREAYIDACVYKVDKDYADKFIRNYLYTARPQYYLMLQAFFYPGDNERYDRAKKLVNLSNTDKFKNILEDITEYISAVYNDSADEYFEEMEIELETL